MIDSPPAVCGETHTVGSENASFVVLRLADRDIALRGPTAAELAGYAGRVCVTIATTAHLPPTGETATISSYRLVGDGHRAPIVGVVRRTARGFVLVTGDGRRFRLRGAGLERLADRRVYVIARWRDGALDVGAFGLLGG